MSNRQRISPRRATLLVLAHALITGCSRDEATARQTDAPGGAGPRDTTVILSSSVRPSTPHGADAPRAGCFAIAQVLRTAATAIGDSVSAVTAPRDTTIEFGGVERTGPESACIFAWHDSAHYAPLDSLYGRLEQSGWLRRSELFQADGPDGEVTAFSRAGAACIVDGSWDGHDDSDSTYVPKPGFRFEVRCFPDRPDPR
jgi:hypothetical protein